jgi:hypothetical protein
MPFAAVVAVAVVVVGAVGAVAAAEARIPYSFVSAVVSEPAPLPLLLRFFPPLATA